jgi:hypothetical protein
LLPLARRIAAEPDLHDQLLEFCAPRRTVEIETIPLAPADPLAPPDGAKEEDAEWADVDLPPEPPLGAGQLELHLGRLRGRLEEHTGSQLFAGLVALKENLLEEMLHPSFWDDQERAHTVNRTVYHLDRIIKRMQDLQRQVESLSIPMGTARKDPAVLARLSRRVRALESRVAIAELELLATDGEKVSTIGARLSIAPLPRGGDMGDGSWPLTLMAMYQGWAERHGYEVESEAVGASLVLRGGNLAGILGGEAGIHKRRTVTVKGEARRTTIDEALVTVSPLEDDGPETPENREVVRLYSFARAHTIRDPRTGQRSSRTRDVLQGDIDAFLVAYLSSTERPAEEGAAVGA